MQHKNTLMHAILKGMPWGRFDRLVDNTGADKGVRTLSTKSQFLALVHAQLSGATSLREIVATMASHESRLYHLGAAAPKRSTLADANRDRAADIFVAVFEAVLAQARPGLRRASKEALRLLDATSVPLTALSRDWACYAAHQPAAKLHVVFDPDAGTPVRFAITAQRVNDITPAKALPVEAGVTYVFDLGYYDFGWWAKLSAAGCRFVTRLKRNTPTRLVAERAIAPDVAARGRIIADRVVRLPERLAGSRRQPLACDLREVHVRLDTGKVLRIVSNDLDAPAEAIADVYKKRWDIELFFRWVKQTLKIGKFLGTSENAVRIQIAVALITYVLLRIAHRTQTAITSLLAFTRLVRSNLMHFKTVHDLATSDPRRPKTPPNQLALTLC